VDILENETFTVPNALLSRGESLPYTALRLDSIVLAVTAPLRAVLRTIHRLMQAFGGTDNFRNLVDTELPKSLKRIFQLSKKLGPRVFAMGEWASKT
jgi:hypothetical protein